MSPGSLPDVVGDLRRGNEPLLGEVFEPGYFARVSGTAMA
jgi:hypothetical protein